LLSQGYDTERIDKVFSIVPKVGRYFDIQQIISMGITVDWKDFDFEHLLIFAWIKQGAGGG